MNEKDHASEDYGVNPAYLPPPKLWEVFEGLLEPWPPRPLGGRPHMPDKDAFFAIYYILITGIQWKALPKSLGASSTVHDRFQKWIDEGVFIDLWRVSLFIYAYIKGIEWGWQAIDGANSKAPLGRENTGPNPTDRAKKGTKRVLQTDGNGIPLSLVVAPVNRNDFKVTKDVLDNSVIDRPAPTEEEPQNMCLDKGFDYPEVDQLLDEYGYTAHISRRGEDDSKKAKIPGYRSRRWVVERTHSWMNRHRRILIRWEKKTENYEAFLHIACAYITLKQAEVFG